MKAGLAARSIARSHIGTVRLINEDRVLNLVEHGLYAVADGMGGHAMGDVAAQTVVATLPEFAASARSLGKLAAALAEANRRVVELGHEANRQCGSTVAGVCLLDSDAVIFWAGDSRVYRRQAGQVALLTHDHRVVQDLIDAGLIEVAAARRHPRAAVITRAIGADVMLDLATRAEPLLAGDTFLICSDGLSDSIEDEDIQEALANPDDEAADRLLDAALSAGGTDNISFVLLTIDRHGDESGGLDRNAVHTQF